MEFESKLESKSLLRLLAKTHNQTTKNKMRLDQLIYSRVYVYEALPEESNY